MSSSKAITVRGKGCPSVTAAMLLLLVSVVFAVTALAQSTQALQVPVGSDVTDSSNDAANASNDPATPHTQVILQNYFMPSPLGHSGRSADAEMVRLYLPFTLFGVQSSFRIYQPVVTNPLFPNGRDGGLGDTTVYDLVLHQVNKFTVGAGPLLVVPGASHNNTGLGKWQAGAAGVVSTKRSWGLVALVITYQHSDRPGANLVTVQPLVFFNLKGHFYLRSSGFWSLNYGSHVSDIPIGFGVGKVCTLPSGTVMNLYLEPQYSAYRTGIGSPTWQIVSGLVFTFPKGEGITAHDTVGKR